MLYTAIDPSTAILEVAVHKGLYSLDTVPHTLLEIGMVDLAQVHVVDTASIPNPNWLRPGTVSGGQQAFGDALFAIHPMVLIPGVVSTHSWNLLIEVSAAKGLFKLRSSEPFALNPRLNPLGVAVAR